MQVYLYTRVDQFVSYTIFFSTQQWRFVCKNFISVLEKMSERDRHIFNFDVRQINWRTYIQNYILGGRRYILKEKDDTIPAALVSLNRLFWLQKATHALVLLIFGYFVYKLFYWLKYSKFENYRYDIYFLLISGGCINFYCLIKQIYMWRHSLSLTSILN